MHGRVGTFLKRLYYFSGLAYYLYHWFFLLGGAGLAGGIIAALLHSPYLAYSLVPVSLCVLGLGVIVWSTRATMQFQSHNPQIEDHG